MQLAPVRWGGGTVDDNVWGSDEWDGRESSPQTGRRLRGGKVARRKETGAKETRGTAA